MSFRVFFLFGVGVVFLALGASCESARAQPQERSSRADALAAHSEEAEGGRARRTRARAENPCMPGELAWERGPEVSFCATVCNDDADCASSERCRVLDRDKPTGLFFAADRAEEFLAATVVGEKSPTDECEENCSDIAEQYPPNVVSSPLAVCDPFYDVEGSLLSAAEEEAVAQGADIADADVTAGRN